MVGAAGGMEKGDLLMLQTKIKKDPSGYEDELLLQLRHFQACMSIFLLNPLQAGGSSSQDPAAAKELADMTMFLSHMAPLFPQHLKQLPLQIVQLLRSQTPMQPSLRRHLTQSIILMRNRKMIELVEILPVLMEQQTIGDRILRKLCALHVVQDIRRMNLKHKNNPQNKALQNVLFKLVQDDDEVKAKRALVVLAELHRRKVWVDERTSNAICTACFHKSSRIMISALRFLLGYDREIKEADDSDDDEADVEKPSGAVSVDREAFYKAHHKGTVSSQKKKQAKLQRAIRSMKKQQRLESTKAEYVGYIPLKHVYDPQKFAEKLFERLRSCNERFEVKLMMMSVISRAIGIHRLILLNFYPFLQKYIQPHQRDVTHLLAAAVQACHDLVPPDAVETLVRQLVNQFVHDRARPEVIAVGLNVVREMCIRMPLIMTEELLRDLAAYKKSREKAISSAARGLIAVYRQLWPSLLEKKDRGRGANLQAQPRAFGAAEVASGVPGAELLQEDDASDENSDLVEGNLNEEGESSDDEDSDLQTENSNGDNDLETSELEETDPGGDDDLRGDDEDDDELDGESDDDEGDQDTDLDEDEDAEVQVEDGKEAGSLGDGDANVAEPNNRKRKFVTDGPIQEQSLRNLKRLAAGGASAASEAVSQDGDGILSNEDFERIRKLQAKRATQTALAAHGMAKGSKGKNTPIKIPESNSISDRRVDPSDLEPMIRKRREREERIAAAKAGREDRPAFGARTAVKKKKSGGLSNREKEKRKGLPLAAKRARIARSKESKKVKGRSAAKQFRGKKAWKQ